MNRRGFLVAVASTLALSSVQGRTESKDPSKLRMARSIAGSIIFAPPPCLELSGPAALASN
jgi:hypothetical protein